jgi:hypothetical protein
MGPASGKARGGSFAETRRSKYCNEPFTSVITIGHREVKEPWCRRRQRDFKQRGCQLTHDTVNKYCTLLYIHAYVTIPSTRRAQLQPHRSESAVSHRSVQLGEKPFVAPLPWRQQRNPQCRAVGSQRETCHQTQRVCRDEAGHRQYEIGCHQ